MSNSPTPPHFVICGAYRSGSSTLRRTLGSHPEIFMPSLAEPSFFAIEDGRFPEHLMTSDRDPFHRRRTTDLATYLQLFDDAGGLLTGECSPEYLRHPRSIERLVLHNPDVRIVLTLRDPADRLISDWMMCRRDGVEALGLIEALGAAASRRGSGEFGGHYMATSLYSEQLPTLLEAAPADQVHIMIYEEWTIDFDRSMAQLAGFLGVDTSVVLGRRRENMSGVPTNSVAAGALRLRRRLAPHLSQIVPRSIVSVADRLISGSMDRTVDPELRSYVRGLFEDQVSETEAILGREIPAWHHSVPS